MRVTCNDIDITLVIRFCFRPQSSTMKTLTPSLPRRESLNLRISAASRSLIDRAAQSTGKTRTDFILEAARRAAEETLLEQAMISVNPQAYQAFLARLDAPVLPNAALQRTMRTEPPWAKG